MLIKLTVSNFKSFERKTSFTMISSNKIQGNKDHKVRLMTSTNVLKYAVIYGANASGKSNLVEAFNFIKYCIRSGVPAESAEFFCKSSKENKNTPSEFEIQFSLDKKIYAYGFSVLMNSREIESEWLYQLHQNGSAYPIFEWERGTVPAFGENLILKGTDASRASTYIEDFDENTGTLFLSAMSKGKKYSPESKLAVIKDIFCYLSNNIIICTPNTSITDFQRYYDEASLNRIANIIKTFDTGISEITIEDTTWAEVEKEVPGAILKDVRKDIKEEIERSTNTPLRCSLRNELSFYNFEYKPGQEIKITTLKLKHGNSFYGFKYKEESDGTRRLFEFLDMLLTDQPSRVYVIDEMERSLHPKLTQHFIELFSEVHKNDDVQLIITTHEASIMDQNLFRRDEIWFVERDANNVSSLYSLDRFKERYDKRLSKSYLDGRYGAVPVFSTFRFKGE